MIKTLNNTFLYQFVLLSVLVVNSANAEEKLTEKSWFTYVISTITPSSIDGSARALYTKPFATSIDCSKKNPCSLYTATGKAEPGDVVFLRGGIYPISKNFSFSGGNLNSPVIYESYPGEWAILDGSNHPRGSRVHIRIVDDYTVVRRLEIRNMPRQGIHIRSNHNIVEGLHVHGNALSGVQIFSTYKKFPYGAEGSYNIIRDCLIHNNSDVGYFTDGLKNGGNADGISISSGDGNQVIHNMVHNNSDDGIDTWRSTNSYVAYNVVHDNGAGEGNGMGIKAGGKPPSSDTFVEYNISYNNLRRGFTYNSGKEVKFYNNTSFNNGTPGFRVGNDTVLIRNIGAGAIDPKDRISNNNSWQRPGIIVFKSIFPGTVGFLVPIKDSKFEDIGAFASRKPSAPTRLRIQPRQPGK